MFPLHSLQTSTETLTWCPSGKESASNAGDLGSIPGLGRSPEEENGNLLQYSCLEKPMDRGAWQAIFHGITRVGHDLATKPPPPQVKPRKAKALEKKGLLCCLLTRK